MRVPVFHEGTFRALVRAAWRARECLRYRGQYWKPVAGGRRFGIYRPATYSLAWVQQRVEDYELHWYSQLMCGHVGRDGLLRPRTRLRLGPTGSHRSAQMAADASASAPGGGAE